MYLIILFSVGFIELKLRVDTVIKEIIQWFNCIQLLLQHDEYISGHILCILTKGSNTSVDYQMNQSVMSWTLNHISLFVVLWNVSHSLEKIRFSFVAHRRPCTIIIMWLVWFHALYKHLLQHSVILAIILEWWAISPKHYFIRYSLLSVISLSGHQKHSRQNLTI